VNFRCHFLWVFVKDKMMEVQLYCSVDVDLYKATDCIGIEVIHEVNRGFD
jgi:hypothetical protein